MGKERKNTIVMRIIWRSGPFACAWTVIGFEKIFHLARAWGS